MDIGPHVIPAQKYHEIVKRIEAAGLSTEQEMLVPPPATESDLLLVHTPEYLHKLNDDSLTQLERRKLEVPFSRDLFEAMRIAVGGTMLTSRKALSEGIAIHIGGGFHHAFSDHGEGFCLFNDVAIAARSLLADGAVSRILIVDCDLHHGNGTAAIFQSDANVFTFSLHQQHAYPFEKPSGSLDIGLDDGAGDAEYLETLCILSSLLDNFRPDIIFYLAGADPYEHDQLGGLSLTMNGLIRRDQLVIGESKKHGIPLAIVLAGGYSIDLHDTVQIHFNTIVESFTIFDGNGRGHS